VATNRLEDQEISVLSLHLLQICLVYINTLMIQNVLADEAWMERMTEEDRRALNALDSQPRDALRVVGCFCIKVRKPPRA
jgi:hypothetical protein